MSTLEDEIKAMEAQLAEMVEPEKEDESPSEPEKVEEEPSKEPEKPAEEPKVEEKKPEEEDAKGAARLRIEAKKERERADKLAEELKELRAAKEKPADASAEEEQPAEISEIILDKKYDKATDEFKNFEEEVRATNPEYDAVAAEYAAAIKWKVRLDNPKLKGEALNKATMREILNQAGTYAAKGYENPVEAMFNEAKELGFTGASAKEADPAKETEEKAKAKPDMKKVAENRAKSSGMAGSGGGDARGQLTKKYAVENFTLADFSKLSDAEAAALLSA